MQPSTRMLPAVAVALLAGALRAAQINAPQLFVSGGFSTGQLSAVLTALNLAGLAVSPFGVAAAGYVWGAGADVEREWPTLLGATFAAALAGFGVTYLLSTALVALGSGSPELAEFTVQAVYHVATAVGLVGVPLIALAGGAVAWFRSAGAGRAAPAGHGAE